MDARFELAADILVRLRQRGYVALLVGGCVRDRLLGVSPKDYDVATSATPAQISAIFPDAQLVGAHFGVSLITSRPGVAVEVATFRSEGDYADGRHPGAVAFVTDPALDARRRDFTINGLFEDPLSGSVLDFVEGQADLSAQRIRAIGDPARRFQEDHLRMLRAVRLAARLHFTIEPRTLSAIRAQAPAITRISAERIRDELVRILVEGEAARGLELLDSSGLLSYILPEVKAFQGVEQPPEFHPEGDVWKHVLLMLSQMRQPSLTLAFGVLLHDVAKPLTFSHTDRIRFHAHAERGAPFAEEILTRLKFPNEDIQRVSSLVLNHMRFKDVRNMRISTLKRFLRLPHFEEHLELHRLDCLASNGCTDSYEYVQKMLAELQDQQLRPPSLINGADLISAGYTPGPKFKEALIVVETAQLEGEVHSKEEALALVRKVMECPPYQNE